MIADDRQRVMLDRCAKGGRRERPLAWRPTWIARVKTTAILRAIAATGRHGEILPSDRAQHVVVIDDSITDDVDEHPASTTHDIGEC